MCALATSCPHVVKSPSGDNLAMKAALANEQTCIHIRGLGLNWTASVFLQAVVKCYIHCRLATSASLQASYPHVRGKSCVIKQMCPLCAVVEIEAI